MNYGQVRDQVLKLLNQYTMAGASVPGSYNNQQDYLNRIPQLVNDAMMEIATTARKIPATLRLADLTSWEEGEQVRYQLPHDFYQLVSGSVVRTHEGRTLHTNRYCLQGKEYLLVPKQEAGEYSFTYYRYPHLLGESPQDSQELDNTPETHYAVPYFVAAFLVAGDDSFLCALFQNKYADKLGKMGPGVTAEVASVADAYHFFG